MHRDELLELAALEAYGLLDDYESTMFNRSYHLASAAVKQEIVQLQEHLAADESLLPDEGPPEHLRERVLAAVSEAIEREVPGPIANIGGRSDQHTESSWRARSERRRDEGTVHAVLGTTSGQFWRAASFMMGAGAVVLAYMLFITIQHNHELTLLTIEQNTSAQIEQLIGPTSKDFIFDSSTRVVTFASDDPDASYRATLLIREEAGDAFLITDGLPSYGDEQLLRLTVNDARGRSHTLVRFRGKDTLSGQRVSIEQIAFGGEQTWEIVGPNGTILRARTV